MVALLRGQIIDGPMNFCWSSFHLQARWLVDRISRFKEAFKKLKGLWSPGTLVSGPGSLMTLTVPTHYDRDALPVLIGLGPQQVQLLEIELTE
jgi:alkanesulfonate monooxygenase SsuD/methylene tetrahydromethanopterin reductase-like flavin-dependent oxidoreductase (luciferase family)